MQLTRERERTYWRTDDEAGLWLRDGWEQSDPPTTATAYLVGHSGLVREATREIELAKLEYVAKAFFGEPRGREGGAGWTGDAYKYAVYILREEYGKPKAVILRTDGGGSYFYVVDELESAETWTAISRALPEPLLWSLLNSYTHTYHEGCEQATKQAHRLFLAGRLKKKRRGGRVWVEVAPEAAKG